MPSERGCGGIKGIRQRFKPLSQHLLRDGQDEVLQQQWVFMRMKYRKGETTGTDRGFRNEISDVQEFSRMRIDKGIIPRSSGFVADLH